MTDSVTQSKDHNLDQLVEELRSATSSDTSVSPLERNLVDAIDRMWVLLQIARRDIELLQEEQRGWSRQEMSIDHPGSVLVPDEGGAASRQWGSENMEIEDPK